MWFQVKHAFVLTISQFMLMLLVVWYGRCFSSIKFYAHVKFPLKKKTALLGLALESLSRLAQGVIQNLVKSTNVDQELSSSAHA